MNREIIEWIHRPNIKRILLTFSNPKTPGQAEKELEIKKLKLKPFLDYKLIKSLNPQAKKGRLYILTNKARKLIGVESFNKNTCVSGTFYLFNPNIMVFPCIPKNWN